MKKVCLRIRKIYFDAIVKGEKTIDLRANTPFWRKRLLGRIKPKIAVLVCGNKTHRRWIIKINTCKPADFLGRELSEQGKQDIPTELCIATFLGKEVTGSFDGSI